MTDFVPLTTSLDGWFDKPLSKLPRRLRELVEDAFWPISWDVLSAEQRQCHALNQDYQDDPATLDERQHTWDLVVKKQDLEGQIRELELIAATNPLEIESKTRQIADLRQQLDRIQATEAIDSTIARYRDARKLSAAGSKNPAVTNNLITETAVPDVHFLVAREILKERLGATPQEIAIWVWMGKNSGEIDGYRDAPQYDDPPKFHFPPSESFDSRFDYVSEMMHCYFRRSDLDSFTPGDRYLTYLQLVERWRTQLTEQEIVALIKAEGKTEELTGFHPLTGAVQGAGSMGEEGFPPLDQGMFCLAHIEAVERRVFRNATSGVVALSGTDGATIKSEKQCETWLRNLMAAGSPSKSKQQYQVEAIQQYRVSRRGFERAWGNAVAETGNTAWSSPGRKSKRRIDTPK